jgi:hypothetical protein
MNRQFLPFDPDFCLEDGRGAFSFRRTPVDELPIMMMQDTCITQMATSQDMGRSASPQITRKRNPGLPSRPTGESSRPRRVPGEDNDGGGSTKRHAKLVAPDAPSGKETARLEDGRLIKLERQLSETLLA